MILYNLHVFYKYFSLIEVFIVIFDIANTGKILQKLPDDSITTFLNQRRYETFWMLLGHSETTLQLILLGFFFKFACFKAPKALIQDY